MARCHGRKVRGVLFLELKRLSSGADGLWGQGWLHRAGAFRAPYVSHSGSSGRHFGLGCALARSGGIDEAKQLLKQAVAEFAAHGDRRLEGVGQDELSYILLLLGDLENAEKHARSAVERLDVAPEFLCHARAALARDLLARGKADDALREAREARLVLAEVGLLEEGEGLIRLVRAQALRVTGSVESAEEGLDEAAEDVQRKAESIRDSEVQKLLLAIPEHVQKLQLIEEWA